MDPRRTNRRRFLKQSAVLAGVAVGGRSLAAQQAQQADLHNHAAASIDRNPEHPAAFGTRSRYVKIHRPVMMFGATFLPGEPAGMSALSPISQIVGSITPSDLHYVSSHNSPPPDIDPARHTLTIAGMVERPITFTMDELKRLPSVTRVHYVECIANRPSKEATNLEEGWGMVSNSEWTGVPMSVLLNEAGVKAGANWVFAESVDKIKLGTSIPLGKAMDDVLVSYGQNGEPLRPQQGFPLRVNCPGFQGKYQVKWLSLIRVTKRPLISYWEKGHFTKSSTAEQLAGLGGAGLEGEIYLEQGPKSVIIHPSAGDKQLPGPGYYEITGWAWSGAGAVRRVEVSSDGGRSWKDATIQEPSRTRAVTRFYTPWTWDGKEAVLQSRCTDDKGQVQPTDANHAQFWGKSGPPHGNAIQPWRVTNAGILHNAL